MNISIADLRQEYMREGLSRADASTDPFEQFQKWFDCVLETQLPVPNAMTLATATKDGKPSSRIVLMKGFDRDGFVFYTNYNSRKGQDLAENAQAALVFWWAELERQVRAEGRVERVSEQESDCYFQSRPLGSRVGAWVSPQSEVIESRAAMEQELQELVQEYKNGEVPKPPYWGGYRLNPTAIEFWQGRPNRLHDRLLYRRCSNSSWQIQRLAP